MTRTNWLREILSIPPPEPSVDPEAAKIARILDKAAQDALEEETHRKTQKRAYK